MCSTRRRRRRDEADLVREAESPETEEREKPGRLEDVGVGLSVKPGDEEEGVEAEGDETEKRRKDGLLRFSTSDDDVSIAKPSEEKDVSIVGSKRETRVRHTHELVMLAAREKAPKTRKESLTPRSGMYLARKGMWSRCRMWRIF